MSFTTFLEDYEKSYANKKGIVTSDASKIDRVIFELKGNDSGEATRLVKKLDQISRLEKDLKERKETYQDKARQFGDALSKAEDIVLTRVFETASVIMTISKMTARTNVDWKKAFEKMTGEFLPEVAARMEEIIKEYTNVSDVKSTVKGQVKTEGFKDWVEKATNYIKDMISKFTSWGKTYDSKLEKFKTEYKIA